MKNLEQKIFAIQSERDFNDLALEIFQFQYKNNSIYQSFVNALNIDPAQIQHWKDIPCLPIEFFKTHSVVTGHFEPEVNFYSSGTTGSNTSRHKVKSVALYEKSFRKAFEQFYGDPQNYIILGLLPSYLERGGSSLIYMCDRLIKDSNNEKSGFFLSDLDALENIIRNENDKAVLLIGVSYALLYFAEKINRPLPKNTIVMETGGMKGRRKEMIREELHNTLKKAFGVARIHSEYGMTELLSQAYLAENGKFQLPPWARVKITEVNHWCKEVQVGQTGTINVIDLANIYSCSFLSTKDLGKSDENGFEVIGRYDNSDIRGCNLLYTV